MAEFLTHPHRKLLINESILFYFIFDQRFTKTIIFDSVQTGIWK